MGSTFAALHVRGVSVEALRKDVEASILGDEAYVLVVDASPEQETDRRVVIFEDGGGWTVVADADFELDLECADDFAKAVSRRHRADALLVSVHHSDVAMLSRYSKGKLTNSVTVPEDGRVNRKTGHREVKAAFLADLASTAEARARLEQGFIADRTFPEQTISELATTVGLRAPGAGARYLWNDPPKNALRLRFALVDEEPAPTVDWRPPGMEGVAMALTGAAGFSAVVGAPLEVRCSLQAYEGPRVEGLRVVFSGSALDSLEVKKVSGWNPLLTPGRQTTIHEPVFRREGSQVVAEFPQSFVEPSPTPTMAAFTPTAFRQWSEALHSAGAKQFSFGLDAVGTRPGSTSLELSVTRLDGSPLPLRPLSTPVVLRPAPRQPVLPGRALESHPRIYEALEAAAGNDWLLGWLAFDAPWAELKDFALDAASRVARWLAVDGPLELGVTSAGTHPPVKARFGAKDALGTSKAFRAVLTHLEREAIVRFQRPFEEQGRGGRQHGSMQLAHQPHGTTLFDPETRAHYESLRPAPRMPPVTLRFHLPKPVDAASLTELLEQLVNEATALSSCVGAVLTPSGYWPQDNELPYEDLIGTSRFCDSVELARSNVRVPGWLSLAPGEAGARLSTQPSVQLKKVTAGTLARSLALTPFAMTDAQRTDAERSVLGALSSLDEIARLFRLNR